MKRLELLIDMARQLSQNTRYDSDSGVPQKVFVQYFQKAHDALYKGIANSKTKFLLTDTVISVVSGQEFYDYPADLFLNNIDTLEWADNTIDYIFLDKGITKDRMSQEIGYPFCYIIRKDGFLLAPPLEAGNLRINYIKTLNNPQKRAGLITTATVTGGALTALIVNAAEGSFDGAEINSDYFLCVCDKYGVQKAKNIPYDSVNTTTGAFTLSSHTLGAGESIAVGDYICVGKNVTNLPEFPDICESFLIDYAVYAAKYGDSSSWSKEAKEDMAQNLQSLLESFKMNTDDIDQIPIINTDFLSMW